MQILVQVLVQHKAVGNYLRLLITMPGAVNEASFKASVFVFERLDVSVACCFMLIDLQRLSLLLE